MMGEDDILPEFYPIPSGSIISVQTYDNDVDEELLEDLQPRFIIMYDPNPAFVRRVEVIYIYITYFSHFVAKKKRKEL